MSELDVTRSTEELFDQWTASKFRCTGKNRHDKQCGNFCDAADYLAFWPGVSDRCGCHVDGLAERTAQIARIARESIADPVDTMWPDERVARIEYLRRRKKRKQEIYRARQAKLAVAKQSEPPPIEPTSSVRDGATGRQDGQLTFGFAASPAAKQPPGFRSPKAVDIKKGERN